MSTLIAVDGVVYDLEASSEAPEGVSALVGEPTPDDEGWRGDPERPAEPTRDGPD
ncbi:MAG TPA: hypothetical protein VFF12_02460 [Myxococcaceae bacterium]|nr:hypothetical protein [Myxococcaceae bacterium]